MKKGDFTGVYCKMIYLPQGSNFTTATTANAVSSAFAVMPFKFGF